MSGMTKQSDQYFMVPVKFIDLYWVEKNAELADGAEPSQTEFMGDLFFNDAVYEHTCEDCGLEIRTGYEDESGCSYCLKCLGEMIAKGWARIEKVEA